MADMVRPWEERGVPDGYVCVYSLQLDTKFVAQVQKASLETKDFGFPTDPALFGSSEWWALIEEGTIPSHWFDGVITRVYWGSMADWPEYTLTAADGTPHDLTRQGDARRYAIGLSLDPPIGV